MGLSNEERYQKIIFGIKRMNVLLPDLEGYRGFSKDCKNVAPLIRRLWSTFLSNAGDGMFWLQGSNTESPQLRANNPFHVAMISVGSSIKDDMAALIIEAKEEEFTARENKERKASGGDLTDYEYGQKYIPTLTQIIRSGSEAAFQQAVVTLQVEVEYMQYALNRDQDQFSSDLQGLKGLIAEIQGVLFAITSEDPIFFEAYLINNICTKILDGPWNSKENLPFKLYKTFSLHHNTRVRERTSIELANLMTVWQSIQFTKPSDTDKVLALLEIAGSTFVCYPAQQKELRQILVKHNKDKTSGKRVRMCEIGALLAKLTKKFTEDKKREKAQYTQNRQYCYLMSSIDMTAETVKTAENIQEAKFAKAIATYKRK